MARSVECKCITGRFTCGYCLRNAPPWHFTVTPTILPIRDMGRVHEER